MNRVRGKVLLAKTGAGIGHVLVEVHDVAGGVSPDRAVGLSAASGSSGSRLGSMLTEVDGSFELEYDDAAILSGDRRPDLLLVVRAPDDMGVDASTGVLHVARDVRRSAGATEAYIIRIPGETLIAAGLSLPTGIALDAEEPEAEAQKLTLAVSRQIAINEAVQRIAAQQVTAERERGAIVDQEVEARLMERLTGVPDRLAERLNYVRPGASVESAMFGALRKSIETSINTAPPAKTYLVLSEAQARRLQNPDGSFREEISADEMEPLLFGDKGGEERPMFLVREDPSTLSQQPETHPELLLEGDPRDRTEDEAAPIAPLAVSPENMPDLLGRLLGTMTSPEAELELGASTRATQEDVEGAITTFRLHSGPADVPAFYDFHSLQIAFDYVWQKAIDEGVIESAQTLSRQLIELGGDPVGALRSGSDPIKALRKELATVQTARANTNLARMLPARSSKADGAPVFSKGRRTLSPALAGALGQIVGNGLVAVDATPFPNDLLNDIEGMLNERYSFEVFAPDSVNFGIVVTYRQRWAPINYQVGNLIKTITLTPNESRKITTRRVVKTDRSVKELENSLRIRKDEANQTSRDEAEIVARAESKTNFNLTAKGSYDIGISSGDATTVFGRDAAAASSDTKKAFREAVIKSAQEYKDERKLEVETRQTYEEDVSESAEIRNSNDELTVTHLFYELQRRYRISEQIHRLTPVVLVAMEVPNPSRNAIDAMLFTHGWILDRVLLDDQFRKPLEYLRTKIVGDETALATLETNLTVLTDVVEELKKSYSQSRTLVNQTADVLTAQMVVRAQATDAEGSEGLWERAKEAVVGEGDDLDVDAARILEDAARERHERAVAQEKALRAQLDSETATLNAASNAFARANAEHLNCLMELQSLRLHVKTNILYYMQAIWSYTFKDQIFLALHKKKVPRLATRKQSYHLSHPAEVPASVTVEPGQVVVEVEASLELDGDLDPERDFVTLAEVADLNNLMGFLGNYLIFPLRESNALTDFMMTPYADSELGLRDPDALGNFTPSEFVAYARRLHEQMKQQVQSGELTEAELEAAVERLREQYKRLLSAPRRAEDEITVPTGSLYVEALPGAHPVLEDYKLLHRATDVKKVRAEVRKLELENLRFAARILSGEHEDPDVEKKIVVEGGAPTIVVPSDA
jgi:hypothetical protein